MSSDTAPVVPAAEPSAPAAPSAPVSTHDIVAETVADLEAADAETPASQPDVSADAAPASPPAELPVPEPPSLEEQLLAEFGFKDAKRPDGRDHRIARATVLKMIGSGLKRGQAKWEGERTVLQQERDRLQQDIADLQREVRGDPKAFLGWLAQHDPRYQAFLEPPATPAAPPPDTDPMPPPDYDLGNGARTYSLDGLQKRDEWVQRQLLAKLESTVEAKLKPLTEREAKAQQAEAERQRQDRIRTELTEAQTWPGFGQLAADGTLTPHQTEVLRLLQEDSAAAQKAGRRPTMTLRQAHLEATVKNLTAAADPAAARAQVIAELNQAPKGTAVTKQSVETSRPAGPRSTADIVRETMTRLDRE